MSDAEFVAALHRAVKPGGHVMIYNISPPPNGPGRPYRPWADGRCPFPRADLERAGFEVLAYDVDDSAAARTQGEALGWGRTSTSTKTSSPSTPCCAAAELR